ncbi:MULTISPECIES: phage capsid protein [unclassified Mesorhizobium]|uniref:phage capsid protein n=1 Tax=unclassified Mesorhizobium TaxID=325217 RepID=UPI0010928698|nr:MULTISPECIES: phage capsid protein [unclassified Mesorhizobium]TGP93838.1 hypothetical protein EN861_17270 [Mesorhizobium sp. M8A.F.Ca.ET.218.01.1.1]TGT18134.1 hypothetical protein EN856_16795 [Mesorhizobium sp. M8A.F.Ca.ET.213.01.1.1]
MADIQAWYREVIKDKVTIKFQAHGGLLDGTMMAGDTQANTVKFPIAGRTTVYELTGAIEPVPTGTLDLTTVQLTMRDFEASGWWRTQDAYKAGPSEQNTLANLITKAVRRKRDGLKIDALTTFCNANAGGEIITIGTGAEIPDIVHFETGRAQIAGTGADDDENGAGIFCMLPAMWMTQLCFYREFADAQWVGLENAPFSKTQRMRMKTVRSVNYIEGPDEYFTEYTPGSLEAFMWHHDSMGAEMPWNQENTDMTQDKTKQGSPYLIKAGLGGAALGVQEKGVKRFRLAKILAPTRPVTNTHAV